MFILFMLCREPVPLINGVVLCCAVVWCAVVLLQGATAPGSGCNELDYTETLRARLLLPGPPPPLQMSDFNSPVTRPMNISQVYTSYPHTGMEASGKMSSRGLGRVCVVVGLYKCVDTGATRCVESAHTTDITTHLISISLDPRSQTFRH